MTSVAVQTHPARLDMARLLAEQIGGEVVLDPDPAAGPSSWRTYRAALESAPAGTTHRLVLQDDAETCRNFRAAYDLAAAARPDDVLVFFVGGNPRDHANAILDACRRDRPWARLQPMHWCPTVATSWPTALIPELIRYVEGQRWPAAFHADDEITGRFLRARQLMPLASVPSLVEHRDVVPSLVGRRTMNGDDPGRIACCYIDPACDPAEIDWSAEPWPEHSRPA